MPLAVLREIFSFLSPVLRYDNGGAGRRAGTFFIFWCMSACMTVPIVWGMLVDEGMGDEVLPMLLLTSDAWRPHEDTTGRNCHGDCFFCKWKRRMRRIGRTRAGL